MRLRAARLHGLRARDLLRYLIDSKRSGHAGRLKESAIALDVFSRNAATYDSAINGIVRVSVNRLRELLDRYYADEGRKVLGDSLLLQETLYSILEMSGDIETAASASQKALLQYPASVSIMMHAAYTLAAPGLLAEARALCLCSRYVVSPTTTLASQQHVCMYVESGGTDADAFFSYAMTVAGNHEPQVVLLTAFPIFKKYHRDARWKILREQLKFPQP